MNRLAPEQVAQRHRTLLAAVLLSMWGPVVTALAVLMSQSSTQVADFVRRSVELVALVVSWQVFRRVEGEDPPSPAKQARLERLAAYVVAAALGCSGVVLIFLALSRFPHFQPGGNVYPGLAIAFLGLLTNTWFWRRYARLQKERYHAVIAAQRTLYRSKALMDAGVMAALSAVALCPAHPVTGYVDLLGSVLVAVYLLVNAVTTAREVQGAR